MDTETADALARVQISMWLPARCAVCKKDYADVDDFIARNPRASGPPNEPWTPDPDTGFTDDTCWKDTDTDE